MLKKTLNAYRNRRIASKEVIEEELDFIINYDIKYRMGLSGGSDEGTE